MKNIDSKIMLFVKCSLNMLFWLVDLELIEIRPNPKAETYEKVVLLLRIK